MEKLTWKDKTRLMRKAITDAILFEDDNKTEFLDSFLFYLAETDTFHPFDTDDALTNMDEDNLYNMFCDIENIIISHYADKWNHPPGYKKPKSVTFDPDFALDSFLKYVEEEMEKC